MSAATRLALAAVACVACVACHASSLEHASSPTSDAPAPVVVPVRASFVEIAAGRPLHVELPLCGQQAIAVVSGEATAPAGVLHAGDLLLVRGEGSFDVTGSALVISAATGADRTCDGTEPHTIDAKIVGASVAPDQPFAGGKMHARFDADDRALAPFAYVGRLEGTAAVPEHVHDRSWEVLCAIDAAGTFTIAGTPHRLEPKTCVAVPPNTKHAWVPDAGSTLRAIQFYEPPGPEQRFKQK